MAWTNILNIPGLTYRIEYLAEAGPWLDSPPAEWTEVASTDPVSIISNAFAVVNHNTSADYLWHRYRIIITSPINYPLAVRLRVTARRTAPPGDLFSIGDQGFDQSLMLRTGEMEPFLPMTGESQHNWDSSDYPIFSYHALRGSGGTVDNTVIIEVSSAPPFWITHRGTQEQP